MPDSPKFCIVIPVFNHALTVGRVVREAKNYFPVIVVNDGSTDDTGKILAGEEVLSLITLPENQGKGMALRAGLAEAEKRGFTHAITIDADGQHAPGEIPRFTDASRRQPAAFVIGVRDLVKENAPRGRRITNNISTLTFKLETGLSLTDTQCGYRCYPVHAINRLRVNSQRYAYELEVMVKAAWSGLPLISVPVSADYKAATSRLSHFDPRLDMVRISFLHARLSTQSFCVPALVRKISANGGWHVLPPGKRVATILKLLFSENIETPEKLSLAVGIGIFCGIAPIWGFQMVTAAAIAHKLRLNKAIAVTASHISFPLATPFVLAGGLLVGHYLHTGGILPLNAETLLRQIPSRFAEWFLGSIALGIVAALAATILAWVVSRFFGGKKFKTG